MNSLPAKLSAVLKSYRNLLEEIDDWFTACQTQFPEQVFCRKACSGCCRGLFDITLMDAALLQQGMIQLATDQQQQILARSQVRAQELVRRWPDLPPSWVLNRLPDESWQQMPEDDPIPCPLLSATGECLAYRYRPMICRLHGLPNIDISGEDFSSELCNRNFPDRDPFVTKELRWKFRETFQAEIHLFEEFSRQLCGVALRELDTFIPCVPLIDFTHIDWQAQLTDYASE